MIWKPAFVPSSTTTKQPFSSTLKNDHLLHTYVIEIMDKGTYIIFIVLVIEN